MTRVFTLVCFILLFATAFGALEDCEDFAGAPFQASALVVDGTIRVDVQQLGDTPVDVWFLVDSARAGQVDVFAPKKYRAAVSDDGVLEILPPISSASSFTLNLPVSMGLLLVALLGQRSAVSLAIVVAIAFNVAVNAQPLPGDDELCSDEYPLVVVVYVGPTFNRVEIVKDDVNVVVDTSIRSDWRHNPNDDCDGVTCDSVDFDNQLCGVACGDTNIPGVESFSCGTDNVCQITCQAGYHRCSSTTITDGCVPVTAGSCCGVDCAQAGRNAGPGAACVDGECDYSAPNACAPGWISCDGDAGCLDEQTPESCGTCGNFVDCTGEDNAGPGVGCTDGECDFSGPNACATGYADCDTATPGCETQVISDDQCGGCDINCNDAAYNTNGAATCNPDSATCAFAENCAAGFADCRTDTLGCETATNAEPNCGACGVTCDSGVNAAGPGTCVNSACEYECDPDYQYCPGDDGCATAIFAVDACGSCDKSCNDPALNVQGALCEAGDCVATCVAGFADCDNDIAAGSDGNGCETDVTGAVEFCGACGVDCDTIPNTTAGEGCGLVNSQYTCVGLTCNDGFSNCAADILLGCNIDLTSDVANCGTCGVVCDAAEMHVVNPTCAELPAPEFGACDYDQCATGFQDCDGDRSNGCETPIDSVDHCRSCNNSPTSVSQCSLDTTITHTSGAPTCGANGCVWTCSGNFRNCLPTANGQESGVPLAEFGCETDISLNANCGACGNNCDTKLTVNVDTVACRNNAGAFQCQVTACDAGFAVCPPNAFDVACTTDIKVPLTCGACDNNCNDRPNAAAPACIASGATYVCDFSNKAVHCDAGFYDCNQDESDGCEAVFSNGIDCVEISALPESHVDTWSCPAAPAGGSCAFVCDAGWSDCNGDPADGCETPAGICTSAGPFSSAAGECQTAAATPLYLPLFNKYFDIIRPPFNLDYYYPHNAAAEDVPAFAPFDCLMFSDAAIAEASHVVVGSGSCQPDAENGNKFPTYDATCTFDCVAGFHDCNLYPHDGCEVSEAACGATPCASAFNTDARCGWGVCMDCPTLPGSNYVSTTPAQISKCIAINPVDNKAPDGYCDTSVCIQTLCRDENLDWTDGCEAAQVYRDIYGVAIACGQIDPVVNHLVERPFCDGRPTIDGNPNFDAGRCVYECQTGWTDCDLDPRNGCETQLDPDSDCGATCNVFATVSCGAGVCADCTTLEGTLLVDYGDPVDEDVGADVSPSASTCVKVFVEIASSVEAEQYVCDTSLHYLNPSYDFPSGLNGACQAEFCRDSDGDWTNGCESAQLYGRGPNYNFGNNNRNDVWGVPYIRNPYQEAAIAFNDRFFATPAFDDYSHDALAVPGDFVRWQHLILGVENLPPSQTLRSFVYENPVDCVLSEWSDWGVCTIADDCVPDLDHWLQTRIRTRKVLVQAANGGDCHLPLVEDWFEYTSNDVRIGDGLQIRVAIPSHTFIPVQSKPDAVQADWAYFDRTLVGDEPIQPFGSSPTPRSNDVLGPDDESRDLRLTCAPSRTCTATNSGANAKDPCVLSKWSSWSECSAACDGDYAGGVRIRTREVLEQAFENVASFLCFRDEFYQYDSAGREIGRLNPRDIKPWAGQLYQEDWGCNSHSCAEFNCRDLQQGDYCGDEDGHKHVDCSPLATKAVCDGRDWPTTHASNLALQEVMEDETYEFRWPGHCLYDCTPGWIDCDGIPDNGCEIPISSCAFGIQRSSNGNMLSRDDYLRTSLANVGGNVVFPPYQSERLLTFGDGWINRRPNLHPWGKCIYAYEDRLLPEDRVELLRQACFDQGSNLFENTLGVCQFDGECSRECIKDHGHCDGDENNCVDITRPHRCGYGCVDCFALPWGEGPIGVACVPDGEGDYKCVRDCPAGCWDRDGDWTNGCEVASYRGFPWPDMEEDTGLHDWSEWTLCTRSDNCGLLIDCDGDGSSIYCEFDPSTKCEVGKRQYVHEDDDDGPGDLPSEFYDECNNFESVQLFRNVGIQTRFRHVCTPATQGGVPEPFHFIDIRPPLEDPALAEADRKEAGLQYIPGLLIDGVYYQVKMCDDLDECIECTNQLEGLEGQGYDCALSEWSDWGPCSADCNPVHTYYSYHNWHNYQIGEKRNHGSGFFEDYHIPIQTRTRTVITPASLGGVCPPKSDTWRWFTDKTARGEHAFGYQEDYQLPGIGQETEWLSALDNTYVAQASFLIDARPCNVNVFCDYELDCDALNDYYPGHFVGFYQFNYHAYHEATDANPNPHDHGHDDYNYPWQMNGGDDNQVTCVFHDYWTPQTHGGNDASEFDDVEGGGDIVQDWLPKAPTTNVFGQPYAGDTFTQTGICDMLCDTLNGYTDCDLDLRNGCEPYVYDHSCGRYDCEWGGMVDCTILPGMISPDAAPCENEHVVRRWHPKFWSPDDYTEYANIVDDDETYADPAVIRYLSEDNPTGRFYRNGDVRRRFASDYLVARQWEEYDWHRNNNTYYGCLDAYATDSCSAAQKKRAHGFEVEDEHSFRHLFYRRMIDNDRYSRGFAAHHQCDIRWACDKDYCLDRDRQWRTGCEEARNYRYPYGTYRHALPKILADIASDMETGSLDHLNSATWVVVETEDNEGGYNNYERTYHDVDGGFVGLENSPFPLANALAGAEYHDFRIVVDSANIQALNNGHTSYSVRWSFDCSNPRCHWFIPGEWIADSETYVDDCHTTEDANGLFFGCVGDLRTATVTRVGAQFGPFNLVVNGQASVDKKGEGGNCEFVCASNYRDCDLDPRNGCETEVAVQKNGAFVWLGSCDLASQCDGTTDVHIRQDTSCGAGLCANCHTLPGITPEQGANLEKCFLVVDTRDKNGSCNANYPACLSTNTPHGNCCRPLHVDVFSTGMNSQPTPSGNTIEDGDEFDDFTDAFITFDILYDNNWFYGGVESDAPYNFYNFDADFNPWDNSATQLADPDMYYYPLWVHNVPNDDLVDYLDVDDYTALMLPETGDFSDYYWDNPFAVHNHYGVVYECAIEGACGLEDKCYDWDDRWDNGCEVALGYYVQQTDAGAAYSSNYYGVDWMSIYWGLIKNNVVGPNTFGFDETGLTAFGTWLDGLDDDDDLTAIHFTNHIFEKYFEGGYREAAVILESGKNCNTPPYAPGLPNSPINEPIAAGYAPFNGHNFNNVAEDGFDQSIGRICSATSASNCAEYRWAQNICTAGSGGYVCNDDAYYALFNPLEYAKWDVEAYKAAINDPVDPTAAQEDLLDGTGYCELVQGFDCSFMFSNLKSWVDGVWSPFRHDTVNGKTFAEQYHIKTDFISSVGKWGCDPSLGLCVYECQEGYDDCDGDPSNGCEVDLNGPCADYYFTPYGTRIEDLTNQSPNSVPTSPQYNDNCRGVAKPCPNPVPAGTYCDEEGNRIVGCLGLGDSIYACGIRECVDCTTLSGAYTFPGHNAVPPCSVLPVHIKVTDVDFFETEDLPLTYPCTAYCPDQEDACIEECEGDAGCESGCLSETDCLIACEDDDVNINPVLVPHLVSNYVGRTRHYCDIRFKHVEGCNTDGYTNNPSYTSAPRCIENRCDPHLCVDLDGVFNNGCEVAVNYPVNWFGTRFWDRSDSNHELFTVFNNERAPSRTVDVSDLENRDEHRDFCLGDEGLNNNCDDGSDVDAGQPSAKKCVCDSGDFSGAAGYWSGDNYAYRSLGHNSQELLVQNPFVTDTASPSYLIQVLPSFQFRVDLVSLNNYDLYVNNAKPVTDAGYYMDTAADPPHGNRNFVLDTEPLWFNDANRPYSAVWNCHLHQLPKWTNNAPWLGIKKGSTISREYANIIKGPWYHVDHDVPVKCDGGWNFHVLDKSSTQLNYGEFSSGCPVEDGFLRRINPTIRRVPGTGIQTGSVGTPRIWRDNLVLDTLPYSPIAAGGGSLNYWYQWGPFNEGANTTHESLVVHTNPNGQASANRPNRRDLNGQVLTDVRGTDTAGESGLRYLNVYYDRDLFPGDTGIGVFIQPIGGYCDPYGGASNTDALIDCTPSHMDNLFHGAGTCRFECEAGWADCDGDPTNGCEASLVDDFPVRGSRCGAGVVDYSVVTGGQQQVVPGFQGVRICSQVDPAIRTVGSLVQWANDRSCGAGICVDCGGLGGLFPGVNGAVQVTTRTDANNGIVGATDPDGFDDYEANYPFGQPTRCVSTDSSLDTETDPAVVALVPEGLNEGADRNWDGDWPGFYKCNLKAESCGAGYPSYPVPRATGMDKLAFNYPSYAYYLSATNTHVKFDSGEGAPGTTSQAAVYGWALNTATVFQKNNIYACYKCPEFLQTSLIADLPNGRDIASILVMYGTTIQDPKSALPATIPTGSYFNVVRAAPFSLVFPDSGYRYAIRTCKNLDGDYLNGCETALGYNINYWCGSYWDVSAGTNTNPVDSRSVQGKWVTDQCLWDQSVGVIPFYTNQFLARYNGDDLYGYQSLAEVETLRAVSAVPNNLISNYGVPAFVGADALGAGFNCDILNRLPRSHTHLKRGQVTCLPASGKCNMACENGWIDCDGNPWNGCETDIALCGQNCNVPAGRGVNTAVASATRQCSNIAGIDTLTPEELHPFCDGGRIPPHSWYSWRYSDVQADDQYMQFRDVINDFGNVSPGTEDDPIDSPGTPVLQETIVYGGNAVDLVYEMFDITTHAFDPADFYIHRADVATGQPVTIRGGQLAGTQDAAAVDDAEVLSYTMQYSNTAYFVPIIADNGFWVIDEEDVGTHLSFRDRLTNFFNPDILLDSVSAYTIPGFYDSWNVQVWSYDSENDEYDFTGYKNYPEVLDVSCRVFQRSNVTYPGSGNTAWTNDKRRLFLGANFANDKFFGGEHYFSHLWQEILEVTEDARFDGAFSSYDAGDREDNYWPLASGRCALLCDIGASDCNGDPTDGCEAAHTSTASCGIDYCGNCQNFPGSAIFAGSGRQAECVTNGQTFRSVRGTLFNPFCRTSSTGATTPCDASTCQDVDFSVENPDGWKNGCEQPQGYNQTIWTYPRSAPSPYPDGNGYDPSFNCAWIYDVATYGPEGKDKFNVKHHIDIQQVINGPKKGHCVGRSGQPLSGKCDFACAENWFDLDGDPSNGCEWDLRLCAADGKTAKKYAEYPYDDATGGGLDCTTLSGDDAELLGFVNGLEPWCDGWEGGDGKCHGYTCDHYEGFCDPGEFLKDGCAQEDGSDPEYPDVCGFDWAHHELQRYPGFSRSVQLGFDLTPVSFVSSDDPIEALIHDEFYPLKYIDFEYRDTELPNDSDYANVFGFHLGQRIVGNSILIDDEVYEEAGSFDTFHKFSGVFPDYSYPSTTNKCARCANLDGYESEAVCQYDPRIAGNFKKALLNDVTDIDYYKPWHFAINLDGRFVMPMSVTGNTHGDYFCRLAGDYNSGTDGQCDHTKCVDEDSFWANGCETAVGYEKYSGYFDYHFPAPDWNWFDFDVDSNRALIWKIGQSGDVAEHTPFGSPPILENEAPTGIVTGEIWDYWPNGDWNRGVWCPYLQFWSIATDNYNDGSCYCQPDYNPYWTVRWSNVDDLIDNDPRLKQYADYVNVDIDDYRDELEFQYNDVHRNFDRLELLEDYFWRASDNIEIVPADVTTSWSFPGTAETGFAGFIPNDDVFVLFAHRLWEVPKDGTATLSVVIPYSGCVQITVNGKTIKQCNYNDDSTPISTGPVNVKAGAVYTEIRFFNDEEFEGYNPRGGSDSDLLSVTMAFDLNVDLSAAPAESFSAYSGAEHCHDFYCPHLAPQTVDTWITCSKDDGKCNFVCNVPKGWKDCDLDPMNGCETQTRDELTCGSGCERIDCDTLDGINPFYDAECVYTVEGELDDAHCDNLCGVWERKCNADGSFEEVPLCIDNDELWQTGCETAVNYEEGYQINCRTHYADPALHVARVKPCNGEPGHKFAGKCEFTCEPGWVDCDGDALNGCEHDGTLCQDVNAPHDGKCTGALGYDAFDEGMKRNYNNLWGNEQYAYGYRAVYDCTQLQRSFPGHFIVDTEGIRCDAQTGSITGGLCIGWTCNNTAGYFDCDGDPRNGCEHQSSHENCGSNGECMNCFLLSGNDYNEANPLYILPERLIILSNSPADFHTATVPYWDGLQHTRFYDVMYYLRYEPLDWLGVDIVTNTNDPAADQPIGVLTDKQFPQSGGSLGSQYDFTYGRRIDWRVSCVSENTCNHPDLAAGLAGERENFSGVVSLRDYYPFVKRVQIIAYSDEEGNQQELYDDPNFFLKEGVSPLAGCPTADDADPRSLKEGSGDGCYFLDSVYDYVDFRHKGGRLKVDEVGPNAADFVNPFDRLGCFYLPTEDEGQFGTDGPSYVCSIITADSLGGDESAALANTHCINADGSWLTGHELATRYDFLSFYPVTPDQWNNNVWDTFDCSTMGWVFGQPAKDTSSPDRRYTPTWHVSQRPQAVGCDYPGSGGPIMFDQRRQLTAWQSSDDNVLATGVKDKGLEINELDGYRPGPTNVPGFCYYLCEEGWQDCDGDPRNGCEVDNSKCIDAIGSGPTGWRFHPYYTINSGKAWDGCETALGYGNIYPGGYDCSTLNLDPTIVNTDDDPGTPNFPGMKYVAAYPPPEGLNNLALMYCRPDTGKCDYTCLPHLQDCDGLPSTPGSGVAEACESENGISERCNCVNCNGLPGIPSGSESVCMNAYHEEDADPNVNPDDDYCDVSVCDNTKCVDADENWRNGCERAVNYANTIRADILAEAAAEYGFDAANVFFDCSTFEDPFLAAINHVDWHAVVDPEFIRYGDTALPLSYCDGDVGRCVFTCETGYSDCDGVPHNGCEQPNFLCGPSNDVRPQIDTAEWTGILNELKSDYCPFSKLANRGNGFDCNFLWTDWDDPIRNIDITDATGFVPYCVRDPYDDPELFDEKAGYCHFKCQDGFADCDFDPGCEALTTNNRTCTEDCVNCNTISGLQYTLGKTRGCIVVDGVRQCDLSSCERCENVDGDWRNGCETASQENDQAGVFVTRDDRMNCFMMQREVHRNPELFNRHLHIDLYTAITVTAPLGALDAQVPAGTIFCNDGLVNAGVPGTCYFLCETGYANTNNQGYDGCEDRNGGEDFMPEWRRWPTNTFHENNCLYWDGGEAFIENTLNSRDPILFEHTPRPVECSPSKKK